MTDAEKKMWLNIKGKQLKGLHFYRQKIIGNYIVDFYCPKAKLVIELDGGQHYMNKGKQRDRERDSYLNSIGLKVTHSKAGRALQLKAALEYLQNNVIRKAMKLNGSPSAVFETDADKFYFLATLPIHKLSQACPKPAPSIPQVAGQVTGEVIKLLKILAHSPMSRFKAQTLLKLKGQANFRDRYVTPALNLNLIEMTIPDKPNSRLQKYRLTKKGKEYIRTHMFQES